ncbi:MAG: hypothetical protein V9E82_15880 [Candidatus Nanopelagicales bacterium]
MSVESGLLPAVAFGGQRLGESDEFGHDGGGVEAAVLVAEQGFVQHLGEFAALDDVALGDGLDLRR